MSDRVEPIKSKGKRKRELDKTVRDINRCYGRYEKELGKGDPNDPKSREKSAKYFKAQTVILRNEVKTYISLGYSEEEALKRVLPKAYALVKLGSKYLWNKPHYDVQLIGGILLNDGYASEMATGEGKTLTAALPAYLNALLGKGVHVITPNGYLAKRDQEETSELYELLGLSCGLAEERIHGIPEEALSKKTMEILSSDPKVKVLLSRARNKVEKEKIIAQYMTDPNNRKIVAKARKEAREALEVEDRERRKRAYACDITYGSSSAIAFDYLYDDIATDPNKVVQRPGMPNFAIIDEVDSVLFDDAVTPFTLSGRQDDAELAVSDDARKDAERDISWANSAVEKILNYDEALRARTGGREGLIYEAANTDSFEALVGMDCKEAPEIDMTRAIILDPKTKDYSLTTLGQTILFEYYRGGDINRILEKNVSKIVGMKLNNRPLFQKDVDYTITETGRIKMEPRAFAYLVTSGKIPELYELFQDFGVNELSAKNQVIDNALKAWFVLKEKVDYMLKQPANAKKADERSISILINGRTAEGRVYSNGLQQAVEAKEQTKKKGKYTIKPTVIKNTLASIPTSSFFARYKKVGGMTGTAAIGAFKQLYGLETHEVPRNKPKQAIDYGDRFYRTTEEKNEAIYQNVLESVRRGQPILISTTSVGESQKLHAYLERRFKEDGIDIQIPVLNASVDKLEEEARIISQAGLPGHVTISTEMAGRGTDIKLGGEVPEVADIMEEVIEEYVQVTMENLRKKGKVTDENCDQWLADLRTTARSEKYHDYFKQKAEAKRARLKREQAKAEEEVLAAGGLKVIGSGHFRYSRVDEQVKGRCGRQGNKGSMIFFNDPEDLLRVGVSPTRVSELMRRAPIVEYDGRCIGEPGPKETPIGDIIYEAQARNEEKTQASIKQAQESEATISSCRRFFRTQRDELKHSNEYVDAVEYMMEETTKSIILASSSKDTLRASVKLSRAKLDTEKLISMAEEFLGVKIDPNIIRGFRTVGELNDYLTGLGHDRLQAYVNSVGQEKANEHCKEIVDRMLTRMWDNFEEYTDTIKHQDFLNKLAGNQPIEGAMQSDILQAYRHCEESERAMIVREIVNPEYRKKYGNKARRELKPVRVTAQGVQRVADDYDRKAEEALQQHKQDVEEERKWKISNLAPNVAFFKKRLRVLLKKTSPRVVPSKKTTGSDDDLVSQDFDDGPKAKK